MPVYASVFIENFRERVDNEWFDAQNQKIWLEPVIASENAAKLSISLSLLSLLSLYATMKIICLSTEN